MTESPTETPEQTDVSLQEARKRAMTLLAVGLTPGEVVKHLEGQGLEPGTVRRAVRSSHGLAMMKRQPQRAPVKGRKLLVVGGLAMGAGVAVTIHAFVTRAPAVSYMVAMMALIFGLVQLGRGLIRSL